MWPFRDVKSAFPTYDVENTIGASSKVCGDLAGPGGFRIDGAVEGAIDSDGPIVVGEGGTVEGSIRGRDVVVLGLVRGDVHAAGHLEIGPKGKVLGDIAVQSFRMHTGGVFHGTSCMPGGEERGVPALNGNSESAAARRGRTLPPPNGAVPPPSLSELSELSPLLLMPDDAEAVSHERLLSSSDLEESRETGT